MTFGTNAAAYGDQGSDTLGNVARAVGGLALPNLERLGLGNLDDAVDHQQNNDDDREVAAHASRLGAALQTHECGDRMDAVHSLSLHRPEAEPPAE